ncbi:MAG: FtsX-like permease family protein [Candidatus Lokiarchaeota archaeon]|nr:FtsX-like permease family protein [Candidatus Lokiarchaeota archaeon]
MFLGSRISSRYPEITLTIVIFALSAGILGGILFYIDSIGPTVFEDMLEDSPNHMQIRLTQYYYAHPDITIEEIHSTVQEQSDIESTTDVLILEGFYFSDDYREFTYLGIDELFLERYPRAIDMIEGGHTLSNDSCFISADVAEYRGLEIGDNYTMIWFTSNETHYEIVIEQDFIVAGIYHTKLFERYDYQTQTRRTTLDAIITKHAMNESYGVYGYGGYNRVNHEIWVKFDTGSLSLNDPIALQDQFQNIARRLEQNLIPYITVRNYEILFATIGFASWSLVMSLISISFSVPTLTMGYMLISYNSDMQADQRRRDVGIVKTRGASSWQAGFWVLSNAIFTGTIGSFASILLGIGATFISGTVQELLIFDPALLEDFSLLLQWNSIVFVFSFAFVMGLIVSIPNTIQALIMTPKHAHQIISGTDEERNESLGSPAKELIALAIGMYFLLTLVTLIIFQEGSSYILGSVSVLMFPVIGLITIAGGRLLSRPTAKIKSAFLEKIRSVSLASTRKLLSRTVLLYKKSEAKGIMFVGLVFTAGLFSAISANTGSVHLRELFLFDVGSDINAEIKIGQYANASLEENFTDIEGIEKCSGILQVKTHVSYLENNGYDNFIVNRTMTIIGINPTSWEEVAFLKDYFTVESNPVHVINQLQQDNSSVISSFKPVYRYIPTSFGQRTPIYHNNISIHFETPDGGYQHNCEIVDVMARFDEQRQLYGDGLFPGEPDIESFVIVNLAFLHDIMDTDMITNFYIKTNANANHSAIIPDIYEMGPDLFENVDSAILQTNEVIESRMSQAVYGSYTLNILFSFLYLTAGMIVVTLVKIRNYRKEFSILRALGTENSSILKTSLFETFVGLLLSIGIGSVLALTFSSLVIRIPLVYMGSSLQLSWNRLPVLMVFPIDLILILISLALISAVIATVVIMRHYLSKNIAQEIQYSG